MAPEVMKGLQVEEQLSLKYCTCILLSGSCRSKREEKIAKQITKIKVIRNFL